MDPPVTCSIDFFLKQRKNPFNGEAEDENSHLPNAPVEGESSKRPLRLLVSAKNYFATW